MMNGKQQHSYLRNSNIHSVSVTLLFTITVVFIFIFAKKKKVLCKKHLSQMTYSMCTKRFCCLSYVDRKMFLSHLLSQIYHYHLSVVLSKAYLLLMIPIPRDNTN